MSTTQLLDIRKRPLKQGDFILLARNNYFYTYYVYDDLANIYKTSYLPIVKAILISSDHNNTLKSYIDLIYKNQNCRLSCRKVSIQQIRPFIILDTDPSISNFFSSIDWVTSNIKGPVFSSINIANEDDVLDFSSNF